jgi:hypothetical protein
MPEHLLLAVCCLSNSRGARLLGELGKQPLQLCLFVLEILGRRDEWERWLAGHPEGAQGHDTTALPKYWNWGEIQKDGSHF